MLITRLKQKEEIISLLAGKTAVISCEGCREVYFPADEALEFQEELQRDKIATAVLVCDYICNPDHLMAQTSKSMEIISGADSILVFSCGVGVQTISRNFMDKPVFAACDTIPLPGRQGVTPLEYDCAQCGECFLNDTGGVCPMELLPLYYPQYAGKSNWDGMKEKSVMDCIECGCCDFICSSKIEIRQAIKLGKESLSMQSLSTRGGE